MKKPLPSLVGFWGSLEALLERLQALLAALGGSWHDLGADSSDFDASFGTKQEAGLRGRGFRVEATRRDQAMN